jgi:predicted dehydrogenase
MSEQTSSSGYGLSTVVLAGAGIAPEFAYLPSRPKTYRPKIGLIGCGGISEYHLRAYRAMELEVVALCDCDPSRAEKRRAEFYPDATLFTDFRELLRRDDIEVVDIALHPAERLVAIEAALRARKHVLSQKPFVLDLADGERLVALADAQKVQLAVNQNGRWAPHFSYLTQAVHSGLIGEVGSIDFTLQWDHTWLAGSSFEKIHHLVLFDFGIHWFDMTARLMPGRQAERVWAGVARTEFQQMKPPLLAQVVIDYPGAQVRLGFNAQVKYGQEDRTVICGSRGTLRSFGPSLSEQTVTVHTAEATATPVLEGTWFTNGFQGTMGELLCAIESGQRPSHSARENLTSLALCYAALASADTGKPQVPGSIARVPS